MSSLKKNSQQSSNSVIVTRNTGALKEQTGNIYKTIAVLAKRSNQIATQEKEELHAKLAEFASTTDNLEEVFENREQIEISRYYEKQPKPSLRAIAEYHEKNIYFRDPEVAAAVQDADEDSTKK